MTVPENPKIYHILHWDKLASVIDSDGLFCDWLIASDPPIGTTIGMANIKRRRVRKPVVCHWGTKVADYVPFYFCPRSVMLYTIHRKSIDPDSASELDYTGGQRAIVHLEADLREVIDWADASHRRWAFTTGNAATNATRFYDALNYLNKIDWDVVLSPRWSRNQRNVKQSEFLVYGFFSWHLVHRIGVMSHDVRQQVERTIASASHRPPVVVIPQWYFLGTGGRQ